MSTFFCKGFSRGTKCRECCAEKHLKYPPPQYQPPGPKIYRVATEYYSNTRVGKKLFRFSYFSRKNDYFLFSRSPFFILSFIHEIVFLRGKNSQYYEKLCEKCFVSNLNSNTCHTSPCPLQLDKLCAQTLRKFPPPFPPGKN